MNAAQTEFQNSLADLFNQLNARIVELESAPNNAAHNSALMAENDNLQSQIRELNNRLTTHSAPTPIDPNPQLVADRDGAIAQLATVTGERDAALAERDTAQAEVTRLNARIQAAYDETQNS